MDGLACIIDRLDWNLFSLWDSDSCYPLMCAVPVLSTYGTAYDWLICIRISGDLFHV